MTITEFIISFIKKTLRFILELPRYLKLIIVVLLDINLCVFTTWLALYLRQGDFISILDLNKWLVFFSIAFMLLAFTLCGLYRVIFRYSDWQSIKMVLIATALYGILYSCVVTFIGISSIPRTIGLIQPLLLFITTVCFRVLASYFFEDILRNRQKLLKPPKALVYGAGSAGRQLASALANSFEIQVVGFLDDDTRLQGHILNNLPIFSPNNLRFIIKSKKITHVLIAIPSASRRRQSDIFREISKHKVIVRKLPSVEDLVNGRVSISDLRNLDIDDILAREAIAPNVNLLTKNITDKVVLVTGAGGSIGSELCRKIITLGPKKLLLLDINEFGLYIIHDELESICKLMELNNKCVVPLLASVQDKSRMREIIKTWKPETVYHAAAYKHVPLVEYNLCEGLKNNVIGTLNTIEVAIEKGVADFVLISTDKAVRSTNVMGASKRLAELCLQALYNKQISNIIVKEGTVVDDVKTVKISKTKLSIVRFGNVLGSSGSVIPKFRKQIENGGPITITHSEITRYFMTIPEAAELVIQAGAMAKGGEVFVLDMGRPIKIIDLARRMIDLSGLSVRDQNNLDGDIDIVVTGLRPGEKLYEELLLGDNPQSTMHKKIYRAQDPYTPWNNLEPDLNKLRNLLSLNEVEKTKYLLQKLVNGYKPNKEIVDYFFVEKKKSDSANRLNEF